MADAQFAERLAEPENQKLCIPKSFGSSGKVSRTDTSAQYATMFKGIPAMFNSSTSA